MPVAKIQFPDGRVGRFEVPEGTTPEEVMSFAQGLPLETQESKYTLPSASQTKGRTILDQGLQGLTGNFADEITGTLGGLGAKAYDMITGGGLLQGESGVNAGIDIARQNLNAQQEQRPVLSTASQIGGAVASALPVGMAIKGASLPLKVATGATLGGASGALYGAGGAEGGVEERIQGAKESAIPGAIIGGAIPIAGKVIEPLVNKTGEVIKTLYKGRDADKILASRLSGVNLATLKNQLSDSEIGVLPDIAGDEVQGLMRAVGRVPGGAKNIVSEFLETRSDDSVSRVSNLLSKKISNVDTYFGQLDDVAKARALVSAPLYKQAYSEAPNIKDPGLFKFMQDKRIIDAISEAKKSYGVRVEAPANSLETLDGVKKVLDDLRDSAYSGGKKQLAKSYTDLKNQMIPYLEKASPTYKKARQTFAGFAELEEAQKLGKDFTNFHPEELKKLAKNMTASELEAFKIGMRANLQTTVSRTAEGGDPARRIFGNPYKKDQIKAVFGDDQTVKEFAKRLQEEMNAANTKFKVLGGSRSDINLAEDGSPLIEAAGRAIRDGRGGVAREIADALATGIQNRFVGLNRENSQRLARILTSKKEGIKAIDRIIAINKNNPSQQKLLNETKSFAKEMGLISTYNVITTGE